MLEATNQIHHVTYFGLPDGQFLCRGRIYPEIFIGIVPGKVDINKDTALSFAN